MIGTTDKIRIVNLTKYYGKTRGIENLSITIKEGEIFGFLGPNGAGKTTTIRCMLSILLPTEGEIWINGDKATRQNAAMRDNIGYIPGELFLPEYFKVNDFLDYIDTMRSKPSIFRSKLVDLFQLPTNKKIGELSKGNKQKVGIISALMHDPDVLILDEPTSGLDPLLQNVVYDLLLDAKKRGKTVFFSSHNLSEVQKICDRVGIVKDGQLINIEDVESLSKSVPRLLKVKLNKPDIVKLEALDLTIYHKSEQEQTFDIIIPPTKPIHTFLDALVPMEPLDLSFPPASLEEYFMQFYRKTD